jgi:hypothetical protein
MFLRRSKHGIFLAAAMLLIPSVALAASIKRGVAYDLASSADLKALSAGVTWWYNWGSTPNAKVPPDYRTRYRMDYFPMLWNGDFNASSIAAFLKARPSIRYLLVLNEPNVGGQAYLTPQQAAALWPRYEAIAAHAKVQIVGPQITWGTMPNYADPVAWLDAFYAAYKGAHGGRAPRIDYLGFHWYDYGLDGQLDRLGKYKKPFWVTEFANWHSQQDGAEINTVPEQEKQMTAMVAICENRGDVFRYAWFSGRVIPDPHHSSLLGAPGQLTKLGQLYISLPYASAQRAADRSSAP